MLRKTDLLTSGLMVLVALAGQNVVHAGHHGGGGHNGGGHSGGSHSGMSGMNSSFKTSSMNHHSTGSLNLQHLSNNTSHKNVGHNLSHLNHSQHNNNQHQVNLKHLNNNQHNNHQSHNGMGSGHHSKINLASYAGTNFGKSFNGHCSPKSSSFWNCGAFGCYNFGCYPYSCSYPSWGYGYNYGCCGYGYGYGCNYTCGNYVYTPYCYSAVPVGCIQPYYVTAYQTCYAPVCAVPVVEPTGYLTTTVCPTLSTVAQAISPISMPGVDSGYVPPSPGSIN